MTKNSNEEHYKELKLANEKNQEDKITLAKELKDSNKELPKMYVWCGTEDFLYEDNEVAVKYLKELGYDVIYETSEGTHAWNYWDDKIQRVLEWLPNTK